MTIITVGVVEMFGETRKYQIFDETISGKYVCRLMPQVMTRPDGSQYLAEAPYGLFLKSKTEFINVYKEEFKEGK